MKRLVLETQEYQHIRKAMVQEDEMYAQGKATLSNPDISASSQLKQQLAKSESFGMLTVVGLALVRRRRLLGLAELLKELCGLRLCLVAKAQHRSLEVHPWHPASALRVPRHVPNRRVRLPGESLDHVGG